MTNENVLEIVSQRILPETRIAFISAIQTLMLHGHLIWLEDLNLMYSNQEAQDINTQEVIGLIYGHLEKLSLSLGIVFTEDCGFIYMASRMSKIMKLQYPTETEPVDIELYYASEYSRIFDTNPLAEVQKIVDCDGIHENIRELTVHNLVGLEGPDLDLPAKYLAYKRMMDTLFPETKLRIDILTGLTGMGSMMVDYYLLNVEFEKLTDDEVISSVILTTILDRESRNLSKRARKEMFATLAKDLPDERFFGLESKYNLAVETLHGAEYDEG